MERIKIWFTSRNMSWLKVIIFAVITAVVTAVLNLIPLFKDTSFQDIAISFECWIVFAVFIIINCSRWWEASLKTFVFFLISQPLIYLIEVPFSEQGFGLFMYYRYWFILTLLTLPGAAIAFLIKRKDWLSVAVLSVATCFLGDLAVNYFWVVKVHFPHHLLTLIFCVASAFALIYIVLDKRSHRIVACILVAATIAVSLYMTKPVTNYTLSLPEGSWTCTVKDDSLVDISSEDGNTFKLHAEKAGTTLLTFQSEDGSIVEYYVSVTSGGIFVDKYE